MTNTVKAIFIGLATLPAVGRWVELPCDDIRSEIAAIVEEYGSEYDCSEVICADAEGMPYPGECPDWDALNEDAQRFAELDEEQQTIFDALTDEGGISTDEALDIIEGGDYILWAGCSDMSDVAEEYAESCGLLDSIPENLRYYFDFEAFGRDMEIEGTFIYSDLGYIEVIR